MVYKDKPGPSKAKGKLKFNPMEKVTTLCPWKAKFVKGSYCMNFKSLFLFHLSVLKGEKKIEEEKKKQRKEILI